MTLPDPRAFLRQLFDTAVAAADPMVAVPAHLPALPQGRTVVIGAGKASARMGEALEAAWQGPLSGLIITRYGYARPCRQIEVVEAAHPVPDEAGRVAAERMLQVVAGLGPDDLVIALISGGGSALMPLPAGDITLAEKQEVNRQLLACGANIIEMNTVRKQLSRIKGGRLAAACHPARLVSLMISDVPGDDPSVIASGPTVGEPTTPEDARAIVARYGLDLPASCARHLAVTEGCPAPDDPRLAQAETIIISAPQISLEAAAREAAAQGVTPLILGDSIEGEASQVGIALAGIAQQVVTHGQPLPRPCVLLSGGETTVTLRGTGRGGRNVECLLAAVIQLQGRPVWALMGDTDGVDGAEEVAGAIATPDTLDRARTAGLDPHAELANNNAHGFFETLGDQVIPGPTLTNVNDFRALYIPWGAGLEQKRI
ncbi:MAG: glycerate kinase [Pseudomonadota bacterium]